MNLIIDVGNTLVKLAVFEQQIIQYKKVCIKKDFLSVLNEVAELYPDITNTMLAMVGTLTEHQLAQVEKLYTVSVLSNETKVPFQNKYTTPKTLGVDRIALVSAAAAKYPNKDVLIIDSGSCITYDFINSENEYFGGAISPGLSMRYSSLNTFTAKLPLLDVSLPKKLIGDTTAASIHSGVVNGVLYEIDGFISSYKANYSDLTIILTGGDAHFLRDRLKNDIFANSNFLLEGLNYILELIKD
tara:strand:+ start:55015 stop:55743 length:729 start_codon:yes stop_codon:yes gene_type:complete